MRNRCEAFEDAIWDRVRFGTDLPADARAHIDRCADCARALNEAGQLAGVVLQADCVPPAPDCRSAVMARIAPRQRQPRLAWAYACAGLAIASLAIGAIMSLGPNQGPVGRSVATAPRPVSPKLVGPAPDRNVGLYTNSGERYNPPTRIVKQPAKPKTPENVMVAGAISGPAGAIENIPVPETREEIALDAAKDKLTVATAPAEKTSPALADDLPRVTESLDALSATASDETYSLTYDGAVAAFSVAPNRDATKAKGDSGSAFLATNAGTAPTLNGEAARFKAANQPAPADDRPVAIVIASWTPSEARPVSYGYDYTDYDTVTGRTTTVSVKRLGNHVEVRLEGKEPPVKGSIDHATIPSV